MDDNNIVPQVSYSNDGEYIFIRNQSLYITDKYGVIITYVEGNSSSYITNVAQLGEKVLITRNDGSAWICCTPSASSIHQANSADVPKLCEAYEPHQFPADNKFTGLRGEHELSDAFKATTYLTDLSAKLWFSTDGNRVALSYPDGVIEVFEDPESGSVSIMLGQRTQEITSLAMTEKWLIASDAGGRLMFYDLEKREVAKILNTELPSAGFAFDAKHEKLMSARTMSDSTGSITVYDVYDIEKTELLFTMRATETVSEFGFAEDGSCALCITSSGALRGELWTDEKELLAYARRLLGVSS